MLRVSIGYCGFFLSLKTILPSYNSILNERFISSLMVVNRYNLLYFFAVTTFFVGDLDSLRRDLEDPARPMKSSAFASEEPAPFTPVSLKGLAGVPVA